MKHWNRRKKKYPLDPILLPKNDCEISFIRSLGNTYALKTGPFCQSSGSSNSQKISRNLEEEILHTTPKTINLPPVSMSGLNYVTRTLTKSIGGQRHGLVRKSPHKGASTNRDHLSRVTKVNERHIVDFEHHSPSMFSMGLESNPRY
jgi:hypothetical protein